MSNKATMKRPIGLARATPLLLMAVIASTGWAAQAQVAQVYHDRVLDANPQVGSGGSNRPVPGYTPISGNAIVSGNVSGLAYFHGPSVGNPYAFQANLPSAALSGFERQSAPLDYTSGQGATQKYYFNPSSQTAGLAYNGQIAVAAPKGNGFDSNFGYYGNTNVAAPGNSYVPPKTQSLGNPLQPLPLGVQAPAYNYQSLAAPGDYNEGQLSALYASQPLNVSNSQTADQYANQVQRTADNNLDKSQLVTNGKNSDNPSGDNALDAQQPGNAERIKTRVHGGAGEKPLDQQIAPDGTTGVRNVRPPADLYQQLMNALAANQKRAALEPMTPAPGTSTPAKIDPLTGKPIPTNGTPPGTPGGPNAPAESGTAYQSDNPALPNYRPASMIRNQAANALETKATLQAGRTIPPLSTLAGDSHSAFDEVMTRGEQQLRAGMYLRAADTYQGALQLNPDNALALVGRAHAELGAGLVESAAYDLKFLWQRKPALIAVHYDLGAFLPKKRLAFVQSDLNELAKQGIPAASLLLAYVQYQQGETRDLIATLDYWKQRQPDPWQDILTKAWIEQADSVPATQPAK